MLAKSLVISRARAQSGVTVLAQALAVAALLTGAAKLRFFLPGSPVPVTLQTFVVLLAGARLGLGAGVAGIALYAAAASAGLPVLAGPSLVGPTGGYVLGFVAAAAVVAGHKPARGWALLARMAAAHLLLYVCGALWLAAYAGQGLLWAAQRGILPFVLGDAAKLLAAWALAHAWRR
jgi:biotin transport system substrate-specific component